MDVSITGLDSGGEIFASVVKHHGAVTLASVCDDDPGRFESVRGVDTYADHEAMIEAEEPDLSVITEVPGSQHAAVRSAVERGSDVFVDKPTTLTVGEFDELLELEEAFDATISAVQNVNFVPEMRSAVETVTGGHVGDVVSVEVDWSEAAGDGDTGPSYADAATGELFKIIPHIVYPALGFADDLLSFSVELQRRDVYSEDPDGFSFVGTDLDDRLVRGQFLSVCPDTNREIRVYGSEGRLTVDLDAREVTTVQDAKTVTRRPVASSDVPAPIRDTWSRGHYVMLDRWYRAKKRGESIPPVPLADDRDVVRIFERLEERWAEEYA